MKWHFKCLKCCARYEYSALSPLSLARARSETSVAQRPSLGTARCAGGGEVMKTEPWRVTCTCAASKWLCATPSPEEDHSRGSGTAAAGAAPPPAAESPSPAFAFPFGLPVGLRLECAPSTCRARRSIARSTPASRCFSCSSRSALTSASRAAIVARCWASSVLSEATSAASSRASARSTAATLAKREGGREGGGVRGR